MVVLLLIAVVGFGLYLTKPPVTETMTERMTQSVTQTVTNTMTETTTQTATATLNQEAIPFTLQQGQMIGNVWVLIQPTGMTGQYALAVYAAGPEPTTWTGSDCIVEGTQTGGSMASVPVTGNATTSEFEVGSNGIGQIFALLNQNPYTSFESIRIFRLSGMQMTNATLVGVASLGMMSSM